MSRDQPTDMAFTSRTVTLGPFETNAYVIARQDTRDAAVLDVGFDPEFVLHLIEKERLVVRWLLVTHAHYDHVGGMEALRRALRVPLRMHPADRPLLHALRAQASMFGLPEVEPPQEIEELADGERLTLGAGTIEVLHTPGHSPGSVTLRGDDCLWVGDLLFAGSIGRTDLPGGSFPDLTRSVRERLFPLGDHLRVLPGHGPETTLGTERQHNPFVGDDAMTS